ncbi:MAG: hypothetical protein IPH31_07600 [Lewinellaceae bacterium]|nr:hypothetical protein [Lewinellaceae bacterium]
MTFDQDIDIDGFQNFMPILSSGFPPYPSAPNEFIITSQEHGETNTFNYRRLQPCPPERRFPDPANPNGWSELEDNPLATDVA